MKPPIFTIFMTCTMYFIRLFKTWFKSLVTSIIRVEIITHFQINMNLNDLAERLIVFETRGHETSGYDLSTKDHDLYRDLLIAISSDLQDTLTPAGKSFCTLLMES